MLEREPAEPDDVSAAVPEGGRRLPVAWKTGTSWGFRDAWSVGIFGPYALAVWVGNFDGQGNPAFVGVQAAAPLFFQIVDAIEQREPHLAIPRAQPAGVRRVSVCALSVRLPGPSCPRTRASWFIPGRSPIEICDIHRSDHGRSTIAAGRRTCPARMRGSVHTEVFEFWPSDLSRLFASAGLAAATGARRSIRAARSPRPQAAPRRASARPLRGSVDLHAAARSSERDRARRPSRTGDACT